MAEKKAKIKHFYPAYEEIIFFDRFETRLSSLEEAKRMSPSNGTNEDDELEWNLWKKVLAYKNADNIVNNFRPSESQSIIFNKIPDLSI